MFFKWNKSGCSVQRRSSFCKNTGNQLDSVAAIAYQLSDTQLSALAHFHGAIDTHPPCPDFGVRMTA